MRKIPFIGAVAAGAVMLCGAASYAQAVGSVAPGTITLYATGWNADMIRVQTTAPFVLNGCTYSDGYIVNPTDPANHAHQSALLSAFLAGKKVSLNISGCYAGRPQILGVIIQ